MFTRKLAGLTAAAMVLGLATVVSAADVKFTAQLIAQRGDPLATGRALWQGQGSRMTLSVTVNNVVSTDVAMVVVDDQLVGAFEIINGSGTLIVNNQQEANQVPRIRPGSEIVLYSSDGERPILYGTFGTR